MCLELQLAPDQALHPLGVLRISQRALPLELKVDKVGTQKPNDVNRLSVAITGGGLAKKDDAFEQFAPAQFQNFSDSDKLSRPAFAPEKSGLNLSGAGADIRSKRANEFGCCPQAAWPSAQIHDTRNHD